jgi:hypothetical protein
MQATAIRAALLLTPISLCAQWLNFKTPGIPRTADGKPDLTAPAPRTSDGKPDLSGLWAAGPNLYWFDIIQNIKDEAVFKPAAEATFQKRIADYNHDGPYTRCLPLGPGDIFDPDPFRIIQSPTEVALLRNDGAAGDDYRQIFIDGRELPKDPIPTWRGYSVGHWEADTLVVETSGFNDSGWLDQAGHPRSEKLHVIERFRRVDFGHIQLQITFDDPETLTGPLTRQLALNYLADTEMLESVCNENERDRAHFAGHFPGESKVKLSAAVLAKYAGEYGPRQGSPTVTLLNDQLYFLDFPLFPASDTRFDSSIASIEFSLDAGGEVTGLTLIGAVGDEIKLVRKP